MAAEITEESLPMFAVDTSPAARRGRDAPLPAAEIGSAHHVFLERMALEPPPTVTGLREEAARLRRQNLLTAEQSARLDLEALAAFLAIARRAASCWASAPPSGANWPSPPAWTRVGTGRFGRAGIHPRRRR